MGILNIRPVERKGSKVLMALCGTSGSGKTLTALKIANGIVDSPSKIGFLDTENYRGSLYSDALGSVKFQIGDLFAPFSPKRYADAIKEFEQSGIEVLIIDSVSHEWFGDGGVEDIAELAIEKGLKIKDWNTAKRQHRKYFMTALLTSTVHIICCVRATEKTDFKNPSKPVSLGIQPITEKNFMFEMLCSVMMYDQGKRQEFIKVPNYLQHAFGSGNGYLGEETGRKILEWVNEGIKEREEYKIAKQQCFKAASLGLVNFKSNWDSIIKNLTALEKEELKKDLNVFKAIADAYDEKAKEEKESEDDSSKVLTKAEIEANRLISLIKSCTSIEQLQKLREDSDLDKSTTLPKSVHVSYFEKFEELSK